MVTLHVPIKFDSKLVLTKDDPCNSTIQKNLVVPKLAFGSNSASYLVR